MSDDLFINTIRGVYTPKPTGKKMIILGENGPIGARLKDKLTNLGHEAVLVSSPSIDIITPELLEGVEVVFLLAYDLELVDIPVGDMGFINLVIKFAAESGVKRIVYLKSMSRVESGHPLNLDPYTRVEIKLVEGNVPATIVHSSILIDLDLSLTHLIHKYARTGKYPLSTQAQSKINECAPLLLDEAVELVAHIPKHEFSRTYHFDMGGKTVVSYEYFLKMFIEKEREKNKSLGIPRLFNQPAQITNEERRIWELFEKKMGFNMVQKNDSLKEMFRRVKITSLFDAMKIV